MATVRMVAHKFDIDLIYLTINGLGTFTVETSQTLLVKRLSLLNGIPLLAMLGYATAVALIVWKPLQRRAEPLSITSQTAQK
jgi:hypothetical protein